MNELIPRNSAMKATHLIAMIGFTATVTCLGGGPRSSAAYSIPTEIADGGGRRTTTAAYNNDSSIGGIGGLSTVASPLQTAKQGYPAQLNDVTNIVLSANPTNVNENSTRQITARLAYDDGTITPLVAASVSWGAVSGPLSGVNASGVATATNVYQDTPATVSGASGGRSNTLGLLVINTGIDDFASYAGDGIDDAWQVQYFGLDNPNARPGLDPDGDGQTNLFEYVAGTIPTDAASKFRLSISNVVGQIDQRALQFSPRFPSRTYTPEARPLVDTGTFLTVTGLVSDAGTVRTVTDTNATGAKKFYRVRIDYP